MNGKPLVSVVIPTYNRKTLVARAIKSVLDQTYDRLELLVIDDGSTDGTGDSLEALRSDPRFRYTFQTNQGQSAARNRGISQAKGDFIAFLDSDNYWQVDKLETQIAFWEENEESDILYSEIIPVDEAGTRITKKDVGRLSGVILSELLRTNFITNNTVLVRKKCFEEMGGFDERLRYAEDYDLWLRFATRYRFLYHPREVTWYCYEGDRLSAQEENVLDANYRILTQFFRRFPTAVTERARKQAWSRFYLWRSETSWSRGKHPQLAGVIKSIFYDPVNHRAWALFARQLISKIVMKLK
ncbi:glycosyltransferase family 2 protein [Geobacter pickeringii]|uniref:Glycosyltransferase 2-like domain-containing protein n=1 Tax=Geobacter pickeringii TaxID=345632 RepID=A0A0B5BE96_9BACT|nr:glycosyltransferase [Geobacter pickeringii]AJE03474.1 hypothetical protein GPICK_09030 [Geobacter pickeringii]